MPASGRAGLTLFEDCLTQRQAGSDRKSTRLNSSHDQISYAVFCLKKKKIFILNQKFFTIRLHFCNHNILCLALLLLPLFLYSPNFIRKYPSVAVDSLIATCRYSIC